jgi:hypothetical protein
MSELLTTLKIKELLISIVHEHLILTICTGVIILIAPYIAKRFSTESDFVYKSLLLVKTVLGAQLGPKATIIIDAWAEGLRSCVDGTFDNNDKVDSFMRFLKIVASKNNIELSEEEMTMIKDLVITSVGMIENKKSRDVQVGIMKFANG